MISQADQQEAQAKSRAMEEMSQLNERNLTRQIREAKPMVVVAGPVGPARNGIARAVASEDKVLLDKSAPFRLKHEPLIAFFARTGVGAHQLRTLSHSELKRLIAVKLANADDVREPKASKIPDKFRVTFDASGMLDAHLAKNNLPPNMLDTWIDGQ
jgi:hypothetical protein